MIQTKERQIATDRHPAFLGLCLSLFVMPVRSKKGSQAQLIASDEDDPLMSISEAESNVSFGVLQPRDPTANSCCRWMPPSSRRISSSCRSLAPGQRRPSRFITPLALPSDAWPQVHWFGGCECQVSELQFQTARALDGACCGYLGVRSRPAKDHPALLRTPFFRMHHALVFASVTRVLGQLSFRVRLCRRR
jgi:hypothetical protein